MTQVAASVGDLSLQSRDLPSAENEKRSKRSKDIIDMARDRRVEENIPEGKVCRSQAWDDMLLT